MKNYYKIDAELLESGGVSFGALVLLGVIESLANINRNTPAEGTIKTTNAKLSHKLAISTEQIKRYKRELQSYGLIAVDIDNNNKQTIIILHDSRTGGQK